jgi:VIT1/CCC1 family predicted Fe2+/Mn2+ transporter
MVPAYFIPLALLAGALVALTGVLLGAFLFYRGRTGKSPVPTVREVKASLRAEEEKVEEKPRFAPPPRLKA